MSAARLIAAGALLVALGLYALAATADNPEAYLFPRLIGIGMALLAIVLLAETFVAGAEHEDRAPVPWLTIAPGIAVFAAYLYAAEALGFYVAASLVFFCLITVYAPERSSVRGWVKRLSVTVVFIGAMYAVFGLLLKVQTPRGVFI